MAGLKPWEIDRMTFNEVYFFVEGVERRTQSVENAARLNAWAIIGSKIKKKIKPSDVWQMKADDYKKQSKRGGVSKEEHLRLVKKWDKVMSKP